MNHEGVCIWLRHPAWVSFEKQQSEAFWCLELGWCLDYI